MIIDMTRHQGSEGLPLVELASSSKQHYRVRTDFQPYETEEGGGVTFIEVMFPYKPAMADIRDFVTSVINAKTDEKILSGFVWDGINVWLSAENQRNFSEAERMAESDSSVLPITFKLGEDAEGSPVYHTFETSEELTSFYKAAFGYINQCLSEGWRQKDAYDYTEYEHQLEEL